MSDDGYLVKDGKLGSHGRDMVQCAGRLSGLLGGDLMEKIGCFTYKQALGDVIEELGQLCSTAIGKKFKPKG